MRLHFVLVVGALCLAAPPARAFTVASTLTRGCHEEITEEALRAVRASTAAAAPIAPDANDAALIDDLPFSLPDDMRDLAAASLLVGVRDNDLKGRSPEDVERLAIVTSDPRTQAEHCLRSPSDDEPTGSIAAIARCWTFIHDRTLLAVSTFDSGDRTDVEVWLSLRHGVTASLPAFWVHIGQALHALQDSFAHSYRTADGSRVTTVLNWIDWANGAYVESRDGPSHKMTMDRCDDQDGDPIITRNRALAVQASTDLLSAAVAKQTDAVDGILAKYIDYTPGCTAANGWCGAPEEAYSAGCACNESRPTRSLVGLAVVLALAWLARRRRLARAALAFALVLAPATARAQEREPRVFVAANVGGSIVDPALAQSIGLRVRVNRHLLVGLDGEVQEWFGLDQPRFEAGAAALYGTAVLRFPMRFERLALRTTFQLGASYELLRLYGVPSGSVGLYAGIFPLGLDWSLGPRARFFFDPLGVAVPVTRLAATPFAYPQFRTQVGFEIGL